ncbi:MAG: hypothetical protein LBK65_00820 [Tannerellaceae bacterium]|jgi:hypothetical protein|nr:hypothetical protein [Tannerellaceae bacterium]
MKKLIIALTGILLLSFASCDGDKKDVDIKYELKVSIDVLDVVKNLKDLDNAELFPNGVIDDGSHVRVKLFIFGEDGSLISEDTQIIDDFSKKSQMTKSMYPGNYTLVASADIVENDGDEIEFQCWEFRNTSSLRNFRIVDLGKRGHEYKAIGVSQNTVEISKSLSTDIRVQPLGAMVTFYFRNLFVSEIAYLYYTWDRQSDYYAVENETTSFIESDAEMEYEVEAEYTGLYDHRYFLPIQDITFLWGTFTKDIDVVKSGNAKFSTSIGHNFTVNVDTRTGTTQVVQSTRAADPISLEDIRRSREMLNKKANEKE